MSESNSLIRQWRLLQFLADARHGYPQGFVFHRGSLYLVAWSSRRGEIRTYKMDRIEDVHSTKLPAAIPEKFDLAEWLEHSFGVFRSNSSQLQTIRIHFAREVRESKAADKWLVQADPGFRDGEAPAFDDRWLSSHKSNDCGPRA